MTVLVQLALHYLCYQLITESNNLQNTITTDVYPKHKTKKPPNRWLFNLIEIVFNTDNVPVYVPSLGNPIYLACSSVISVSVTTNLSHIFNMCPDY